ncbi:MAG: GxxExxY protein [Gammaproteobacteria bacterium]|nr:GxxExxY protein [Gammaproteobacteria bacterium]MDH5629467.1 GxxExxY protein [Gammaproteobacteria bacterium]
MDVKKDSMLSGKIIGCAMEVHRQLGPGLLESIYEECLCYELEQSGINFERQKFIPIDYKGQKLGNKLKIDLMIEDEIIVELKSAKKIESIHEAQLLTYLKLAKKKYG